MKLSIVTICFNSQSTIERTIVSVLNQTIPVYEYIIIDGGSQDNTCKIIENYREQFSGKGIIYKYISEKDNGISDAFNKGIRMSSGDLIGLINSDDELTLNANAIIQNNCKDVFESIDIIYGNCIWIDETNGLKYPKKPLHDFKRLYYDFILIHPSTFIKKDTYIKYGMYNVEYRFCMDKELICKMYDKGASFYYLDYELSVFRAGGTSDRNAIETIKEGIRLSNTYKKPKIITYLNAIRKCAKFYISKFLKRTTIYALLKNK